MAAGRTGHDNAVVEVNVDARPGVTHQIESPAVTWPGCVRGWDGWDGMAPLRRNRERRESLRGLTQKASRLWHLAIATACAAEGKVNGVVLKWA